MTFLHRFVYHLLESEVDPETHLLQCIDACGPLFLTVFYVSHSKDPFQDVGLT